MNTSNAFSDYMVTYSVNRSINLSPTSGRLHRQKDRGSYGPTICLLNRSREKIEESTAPDSKEEALLQRLLMMSIEVERLGHALKEAKTEGEDKLQRSRNREAFILREENQKLRVSLSRSEALQVERDRRHNAEMLELKEKLGAAESEARGLSRRLREAEEQALELERRGKARESQAERAKLEASRMELSMHFNSTNIDLHKSVAREKAIQAESLRQRVIRCEDIIADQKFLISGQKQELAKERLRQAELQSRQTAEIQALRVRHAGQMEALRGQLEFTQRELMNRTEEESRKWEPQVREWRDRANRAEQDLRQKCLLIANQLTTINDHEERNTELTRQLHDLQFTSHSRVIRAEQAGKLAAKEKERETKRMANELQKQAEEIQQLKTIVEEYKLALAEQHHQAEQSKAEITYKLRQKDKQMKRVVKRQREETQAKLNKSLSVDNSLVSNRLKASQVNLESIVSSVIDLKNSNERTSKLITRTISPVRDIYYAK